MCEIVNVCVLSGNLNLSSVLGIVNEDELIPDQSHKSDEVIIKHDWQANTELFIITKYRKGLLETLYMQ